MYKSRINCKKILATVIPLFLISAIALPVFSQSILEKYIQEGIQNNLVVRDKNISLEQSKLALEKAKTYFLPSIDLNTSYTLAVGGRTIDLPVGDLLNNVYSTLNELTNTQSFPQLQNVSEQFNPNNFLDAKVRVSYPLLDPSIRNQRDFRSQYVSLSEKELDIYILDLTRDIKIAYYNYCSAYKSLEVFEDAEKLLEQNVKDNQSLLRNGKGLPARVIRAESEQSALLADKLKAENQLKKARLYLNFLLNQAPDTEISYQPIELKSVNNFLDTNAYDLSENIELQRMENAIQIQQTSIESAESFSTPRIHAFADLGVQTFNFQFENQSPYVMAGVQLTLPIYHNGRNKMKVQEEKLSLQSLQNQKELLNKNLSRQLQSTLLQLKSDYATASATQNRIQSAQKYFELINKSYQAGTASQIEFLDARKQLTEAELQYHIAMYSVMITKAEIQRLLTTQ